MLFCTICCSSHQQPEPLFHLHVSTPIPAREGGWLTWAACSCIISAAGVNAWRESLWWNMFENVTIHYIFRSITPPAFLIETAQTFANPVLSESQVLRKSGLLCSFLCTHTVRTVPLCRQVTKQLVGGSWFFLFHCFLFFFLRNTMVNRVQFLTKDYHHETYLVDYRYLDNIIIITSCLKLKWSYILSN